MTSRTLAQRHFLAGGGGGGGGGGVQGGSAQQDFGSNDFRLANVLPQSTGQGAYAGLVDRCGGVGFEAGIGYSNDEEGATDYGVKYNAKFFDTQFNAGPNCDDRTNGLEGSFTAIDLAAGVQGDGMAFGVGGHFGRLQANTRDVMPNSSASIFGVSAFLDDFDPEQSTDTKVGLNASLGYASEGLPFGFNLNALDEDLDQNPEYTVEAAANIGLLGEVGLSVGSEDPLRRLFVQDTFSPEFNVTRAAGDLWNLMTGKNKGE